MPSFKIVNNISDIELDSSWTDSPQFKSKDRIVNAEGVQVSSDYEGHRYRILAKKERSFSFCERTKRVFQGMLLIAGILPLIRSFNTVRKLFTKQKETIRFGVLEKQTRFRVEQGKIIYIEPQLLFNRANIEGQEVNFALIQTAGRKRLVAVTSASTFDREYTAYEGSACEVLLKLAQTPIPPCHHADGHYGSPISDIFKHPNNSIITEEEFLKFLLEKDRIGTVRIYTLHSDRILELLQIIKEKNIRINLHDRNAEGETLFTLLAAKGYPQIIKALIELDPSVLEQTSEQTPSAFIKAVLSSISEVDLFLTAMETHNISLSLEELWIKRVFKKELTFFDEAFTQLDQELKIKVFFVANALAGCEDVVRKLKLLGMHTAPLFDPRPHPGFSIFAFNMDRATANSVLEGFLKGLRRDGLLLTEEEFSRRDGNAYIGKDHEIGRIQGRDFIERLVQENGLTRIKVPKKIAVIKGGCETISLRLTTRLELVSVGGQLTVYAERIRPVKRQLSLAEAIEFMIILEKSWYTDCYSGNFIYGEDGIYFIDTEFNSFSTEGPNFAAIECIKNAVSPCDMEPFLVEYRKRKQAYENAREIRATAERNYIQAFENPYKQLVMGYRWNAFTFQTAALNS